MHRFYLPPENCRQPVLMLTGGEAHHALGVLRLRRGDRATVLDGAGSEFTCELDSVDQNRAWLRVLETRKAAPPRCLITLLQALPKGKLFETIIQKAVELGAAQVVPLLTTRVVRHLEAKEAEPVQKN